MAMDVIYKRVCVKTFRVTCIIYSKEGHQIDKKKLMTLRVNAIGKTLT